MKYDVVIIGGGLSGLQCAYILTKNGMNVCVVEKEHTTGGCLQAFLRAGYKFDTGFHYVGGLDEGEPLNRLFSYFGLMKLPWVKMDNDNFDEIIIKGESFALANGYDNYAESLSCAFPSQRKSIKEFTDFLQTVNDNIFDTLTTKQHGSTYAQQLLSKPAYNYLKEHFSDEKLIQVISGASLKMELDKTSLPLYLFAQINASYINSAWRLKGDGEQITDALSDSIKAMGGTIITSNGACIFTENQEKLTGVRLSNGEIIYAERFISSIHPAETMKLLKESKLVRKIYRNRISSLKNTYGMFTVNCLMKKECIKYLNRNQYIYTCDDVWEIKDRLGDIPEGIMISYRYPTNNRTYAEQIDILTPMNWGNVAAYENSKPMHRTIEYNKMKDMFACSVIELAETQIPGFKTCIEKVYTSTPLTYRDYTGSEQGSAYGIKKDYNNLMHTLLSPKTPISNLYLTGQNINLHGILGVSMTSFLTCNEIIDYINPF